MRNISYIVLSVLAVGATGCDADSGLIELEKPVLSAEKTFCPTAGSSLCELSWGGIPDDELFVVARFKDGCDKRESEACTSLGEILESTRLGAARLKDAVDLFIRACHLLKDDRGCKKLKRLCERLHCRVEVKDEAARDAAAKCPRDEPVVCDGAGGVAQAKPEQTLVEKRLLPRKRTLPGGIIAAERRSAARLKALGTTKALNVINDDLLRRVTELEQRCKDGDGQACYVAALANRRGGVGVPRDRKRTAWNFKRACDVGHAEGCFRLAILYQAGWGVAKSEQLADEAYRSACSAGSQPACRYLKLRGEL